jgi:hypothetical protein
MGYIGARKTQEQSGVELRHRVRAPPGIAEPPMKVPVSVSHRVQCQPKLQQRESIKPSNAKTDEWVLRVGPTGTKVLNELGRKDATQLR